MVMGTSRCFFARKGIIRHDKIRNILTDKGKICNSFNDILNGTFEI